jgi:DNA-binding response OmpR family regulator
MGMAAAAARQPEAAMRVLVVEDEHQVCDLISDLLDDAGFEAHCVQSDRAAYSVLSATRAYAALVVDINLGSGTTGYDVARFARQVRPDIAVLYVTGQASEQSFRAFGVPNSGYVAKPFEPKDLVASLRLLVEA